MPSRAMRLVVSLSMLAVLLGATVAQAAPGDPGSPFETPPGQVISGKLSIIHGDDFEDTATHTHEDSSVPDHVLPDMSYWLETDQGEELLLEFDGTPPAVTPEGNYEVRGERHGRAFHVAGMQEQAAKGGGGGPGGGGKPPKGTTNSYVGQRDMIVIPFTFAGNPTPLSSTPEQIRDRGFINPRSVRTYYEETSATTTPGLTFRGKNDGTASDKDGLQGDVTETFTITGATDKCDYYGWATAARNKATAAGWDLTGYEHIVYYHPRLTKLEGTKEVWICEWSGLAQVGGTYSWLNDTMALGTWAHELGHNLTLWHSRTSICRSGDEAAIFIAVASSCAFDEYGDPFDTMGTSSNQRQYHARNKTHLGWIPLANVGASVSGQTFVLSPIESATTKLQVLQIPRGRDYLYVDYRRPTGQFDAYAATDDAVNGVLIHSGPAIATNGNSYLFDTTIYPSTVDVNTQLPEPDFSDAALNVGEGFVDPVSGVYIETISVNADGTISVLVRTGVTNTAPVVSAPAPATPPLPGLPRQIPAASATDTEKNLGAYRWSFLSCPGTCPPLAGVVEGALSGGSDSIPGPSYVPAEPGTYELQLQVWDTAGALTTSIIRETVGL